MRSRHRVVRRVGLMGGSHNDQIQYSNNHTCVPGVLTFRPVLPSPVIHRQPDRPHDATTQSESTTTGTRSCQARPKFILTLKMTSSRCTQHIWSLILLLLGGTSDLEAVTPHPQLAFTSGAPASEPGARRNDHHPFATLRIQNKQSNYRLAGISEQSEKYDDTQRKGGRRSTKRAASPHQSRGAFNALLDKMAKEESAQSAERAESLLFDRLRTVAIDELTTDEKSAQDLPYDILSFNIVLNAWAKAANAPRAEALLGRMTHMHGKGIIPFGPNEVSLSTVADAWKRMPDNVEETERVLGIMHEMEDSKKCQGVADPVEDLVSFNQELDLFAREGFPEAAETAEMMLFDSIREAATEAGGKDYMGCDIISFNTVLNCWAKLGNPQRADALLSRLEHLADIGVLPFGPNAISVSTVISAWANSKLQRAPYECEAILTKVEGMFNEEDEDISVDRTKVTPTIHMYAATITAWSRSKRSDAAHRAERILERLEDLNTITKDNMLKPNSVLYTSIIQCWGRSKDSDALERAERVFQRMKESRDPAVTPTEHTYSALLNAYSNSGLGPKSADRADELLLEVESSEKLRGNVYIYTNAIKAWARSDHPKSGKRADEILRSMISSDNPLAKPNIYTFTAALDALIANQECFPFDTKKFLDMMKESGVKPDKVMHAKILKVLEGQGKECT